MSSTAGSSIADSSIADSEAESIADGVGEPGANAGVSHNRASAHSALSCAKVKDDRRARK